MKTIKTFFTLETTFKIVMILFIAITLIGFIIELCSNPEHLQFGNF